MKSEVTFDESAWTILEPLLPSDTIVRGVVLEDFMWFMNRSKKYNNNKEKVEDYIRHLQLKANPVFDVRPNDTRVFNGIDSIRIESLLKNIYFIRR